MFINSINLFNFQGSNACVYYNCHSCECVVQQVTSIYYINERWYVRWETHFTRELSFLKVIETHETTQTKGNLICMHHTRSECPRSPGTPLFGHVKFGFISWNRSSRRLIFQLSLKIILFRLEMFILSDVNCLKVGSEQRMTWVA